MVLLGWYWDMNLLTDLTIMVSTSHYPCILQQLSKLPTELTRGFENIGIALVVEFSHAVI